MFVFKYVFDKVGIVNYKIINDLDILKNYLNDDNIIITSWNSNTNIIYKLNGDFIINPLNKKIINNLNKKYALLVGDQEIPDLNINIFIHENEEKNIFNYIDKI